MSAPREPDRVPPFLLALALAVVAMLVWFGYGEVLGYQLLGHDTLPDILASRVESAGDVPRLFTEPLMGGLFPIDYWRPVLNATFALDHALWGLDPFGYQLTDLLLFAAAALALFLLARRLLGPRALQGPLLASLLFVTFPMQAEIVPVPSRRNHLLCCLFTALALAALVRVPGRSGWRTFAAPGLLAFLAMGSNEIALSLPALFFLVALLLDEPGRAVAARLRTAVVATLPAVVALFLALLGRWSVLGGLGGPHPPRVANLAKLPDVVAGVLLSQPGLESSLAWSVLLAVAALGGLLLVALPDRPGRGGDPVASAVTWRRTVLAGLAWTLIVGLLIASVGRLRPWYTIHPAAGLALAAGGLAQGAWLRFGPEARAREQGRPLALRALGGLVTGALMALFAIHFVVSPLSRSTEQWERASRRMEVFLADLEARLPEAADGTTLRSLPMPVRERPAPRRPGAPEASRVQAPAILGPLSIPAWVRLRYPDRRIEVQLSNAKPQPVPPDGVLLVVDVDAEAER